MITLAFQTAVEPVWVNLLEAHLNSYIYKAYHILVIKSTKKAYVATVVVLQKSNGLPYIRVRD